MYLVILLTLKTSHASNVGVYIRWITPGRALDYPNLSAIPPDSTPIQPNTTIAELKQIAENRVYKAANANETTLVSPFQLGLYLAACPLSTTEEHATTLADIGCTGSLEQPLNIFIVPTSTNPVDEDRPQSLWAFGCSDRGIATFQTCLNALMAEAHGSANVLRRLIAATFRITHFPPALEALQVMTAENRLVPRSVVVLATCFRELALRMVPGGLLGHSTDSVLEGSRQIFSWLYSVYRETISEVDDPEAGLVRTIQLEELDENSPEYYYNPGERCEVVEFEASGGGMLQSHSAAPRGLRKVRVRTHASCRENFYVLALAVWGNYDFITNFYVDFRDNIEKPLGDRRIPLIGPSRFSELLVKANNCNLFRMIPPKDLDGRTSTGITLCKEGFVSLFSINYGQFKDVHSSLENAITGTQTLKADFGDTLLEALQPIITRRKAEGTWEVDDWELRTEAKIEDDNADEAIVICFDISYSMNDPMGSNWVGNSITNTFRKFDEAKQVFENVIARMVGYHLANYTGLVTFGSRDQITVRKPLGRVQKEFKDDMKEVALGSRTALWNGLNVAKEMLVAFKDQHPKTKLRIIVLTDGCDNDSLTTPETICKELYAAEIVLDSIVIGTGEIANLFKISKHTGGYAFCPTSRLLLFQTFLLEPFLDISARPDIQRVPITDYATTIPKRADMQNVYDFPPCRPHPAQSGSFTSLTAASRFFASRPASSIRQSRQSSLAAGLIPDRGGQSEWRFGSSATLVPRPVSHAPSIHSTSSSVSVAKAYLEEMRLMIARPHEAMDIYVNESNMSFWKIIMSGPSASPYERGTFVLMVEMPSNYPQRAPTVRFITPILHPNVTKARLSPNRGHMIIWLTITSMVVSATRYLAIIGGRASISTMLCRISTAC